VSEARKSEDRAVLAEALAEAGYSTSQLDPPRAIKLLTEGFWGAFSIRLDRVAFSTAARLAAIYTLTSHSDQAEAWEQLAQAGLSRMGGNDEIEIELQRALLYRYFEHGKFEESLTAAARAARLSERRFGVDDLRTLRDDVNEIVALGNVGRILEAWQREKSLLARQVTLLGRQHPALANAHMDLALYEIGIGHLAEAQGNLERSEQLLRDTGAIGSWNWMVERLYATDLALAEGRFADAATTAEEALALAEGKSLSNSDPAFELRTNLGSAQVGLGQMAKGIATLTRALKDGEQQLGKDSLTLRFALTALARACARAGRLAEAQKVAERYLALSLKQAGEESYDVADARLELARILVAEGQPAAALALVGQSEPVLRRSVGDEAPRVAAVLRTRGEALAALGRFDESVPALQSSLAIADRTGIDPVERREIRAALDRAKTKKPRLSVGAAAR
jgi:tetratricopeptide (TPR) repeat protein